MLHFPSVELKKFWMMKMDEICDEDIGLFRDAQPTHFSFKISSFSALAMSSIKKVESNSFEVGGYKWSLILYPNGNKKEDGEDYISMYLRMAETSSLPCGWEVNVSFRFFVFDHIRDKYLILGDMGGSTRRFHGAKPEWGFSKLLPLTTLNDPLSGFVVDDTCVFGAEALVCKCTGNGDCLTMLSKPTTGSYKWDIGRFSEQKENLVSDKFVAGGQEWHLYVLPEGDDKEKNNGLSVFLFLAEWKTLTPGRKVYAECKFRLRNQISEEHKEYQDVFCFTVKRLGTSKLIGLAELNDKTKGFLVNDVCIVEAEITVLGTMKNTL